MDMDEKTLIKRMQRGLLCSAQEQFVQTKQNLTKLASHPFVGFVLKEIRPYHI